MLRAEEELKELRINGVTVDPDYYYSLILTITGDEKKARRAQAELMLQQMEYI